MQTIELDGFCTKGTISNPAAVRDVRWTSQITLQNFFGTKHNSAMKRKALLFSWLLLAATTAMQAQFNYTVTNQTVTITGYTGVTPDVVIPSTINGLTVTSIGFDAFLGSAITRVTIPDSVTNIGDQAFYYCSSLTNLTLGNGVSSIGGYACFYCASLGSVTIPSSVTTVGVGAFADCISLRSVHFQGNAPIFVGPGVFVYATPTVYYLPGTTG